jgi:iron complex transport system substrate-binding protein
MLYLIQADNCFSQEKEKLRIISLAPSTTEILFALGLDKEIVGVSTFCNYPPQVMYKEKIGTFSQPNIEKIVALKPDIIFCTGLEQAPALKTLKDLHLNVHLSDPKNINELFDSIMHIAIITGRRKQGEILIQETKSRLAEINSKIEKIPANKRPKIFLEIWNEPLITAAKNSFVDELIAIAGGRNIAHDLRKPYTYISPEYVISRNPDIIIIAYMNNEAFPNTINKRLGWGQISAVKNKRVYDNIKADLLLRPSIRVADAVNALAKHFYPYD